MRAFDRYARHFCYHDKLLQIQQVPGAGLLPSTLEVPYFGMDIGANLFNINPIDTNHELRYFSVNVRYFIFYYIANVGAPFGWLSLGALHAEQLCATAAGCRRGPRLLPDASVRPIVGLGLDLLSNEPVYQNQIGEANSREYRRRLVMGTGPVGVREVATTRGPVWWTRG